MTIHFTNSVVMPVEGNYKCRKITREQFAQKAKIAHEQGNWKSSIGYAQNAQMLSKMVGGNIPLSKEKTDLESGDIMLAMTLKYRVDGYEKGNQVAEDDFEFFVIRYELEPYPNSYSILASTEKGAKCFPPNQSEFDWYSDRLKTMIKSDGVLNYHTTDSRLLEAAQFIHANLGLLNVRLEVDEEKCELCLVAE